MNIEKIKEYVIENGFGITPEPLTAPSGETIQMSNGIRYALKEGMLKQSTIDEVIEKFINGDFGGFYDWDEELVAGSEYGMYDEDIRIHRVSCTLYIYFQFER